MLLNRNIFASYSNKSKNVCTSIEFDLYLSSSIDSNIFLNENFNFLLTCILNTCII